MSREYDKGTRRRYDRGPDNEAPEVGGWRRVDKLLVVEDHAVLPHRCVKCNRPGYKQFKQTFSVPTEAVREIGFFSRLAEEVLSAFFFRRATLRYSGCKGHVWRRRVIGLISIVMLLVGFGFFSLLITQDALRLGVVGLCLIVAGIFLSNGTRAFLTEVEVRDGEAYLLGAGQKFFDDE